MVPQGGRRASGGRGGSGSDAEHLARQSPKNVAQARRFLGARRGRRSGRPTPNQPWRPALPVPPAGPPPSELRRAIQHDRPDPSDPAGRNADRESSAGAPGDRPRRGLQTSLGKNGSSQGRFAAPPPGQGPAAVFWAGGAPRGGVPTRPTRLRGSTTAGRDPESGDRSRLLDRLHQQSLLSWIAFIDRHGKPGRPDGARSRWRVSPTSELGPWRPCESVPGVLPAPPRASRPTPVSSGRPGCQEAAGAAPGLGAAAVARPLRRARG